MNSRGILYVVATPIGNLDDITLRALKVLKLVGLVAAEDTRRTGILLRHFGIDAAILSVHEHNEKDRAGKLINRLAKGDSVALVTDAGTPGISDPGAAVVAEVRKAGFRVEPIPGPSAITAAISASGIDSDGFVFLGFPPIRSKDRKRWFDAAREASRDRLVVFYEAPHKIRKTLEDLVDLVKRPIMVARELSKIHEQFVEGLPQALLENFKEPQGEFTVLIPPAEASEISQELPPEEEVVTLFGQITESGAASSRRGVARLVGERLGISAKQVYDIIERNK